MLPDSDVTWILQFPKPSQMHINSSHHIQFSITRQRCQKLGKKFMNRKRTSKILWERLRSAYSNATSSGLRSCCRSQSSAEEPDGKQKDWRNGRFSNREKVRFAVATLDGAAAAAAFAAAMQRSWEQVCNWKQRDEAILPRPLGSQEWRCRLFELGYSLYHLLLFSLFLFHFVFNLKQW